MFRLDDLNIKSNVFFVVKVYLSFEISEGLHTVREGRQPAYCVYEGGPRGLNRQRR